MNERISNYIPPARQLTAPNDDNFAPYRNLGFAVGREFAALPGRSSAKTVNRSTDPFFQFMLIIGSSPNYKHNGPRQVIYGRKPMEVKLAEFSNIIQDDIMMQYSRFLSQSYFGVNSLKKEKNIHWFLPNIKYPKIKYQKENSLLKFKRKF